MGLKQMAELFTNPAYADLDPEDWELAAATFPQIERARGLIGDEASHPALLIHSLDPTYRSDWRYVDLLSKSFANACAGLLERAEPFKPAPGFLVGTGPKQTWNMPSQYGKTTGLMRGVVWLLKQNPRLRIMYVSFDHSKAIKEAGECRDFIEKHSEALGIRIRRDRRARGMWETTEGGGLYATGIFGGIIGYPADVMLIDDLFKGWQMAHSAASRQLVRDIYRSQIRLRIQSPLTPMIHAGTRWHEDDLTAWLAGQDDEFGDKWHFLRIAAIAERHDPKSADPFVRLPDPLGRPEGEALEPQRFPASEVLARRATLGSYLWSAMEQQRPAPEEGNDIKRAWFQFTDVTVRKADAWLTSWDMTLKDKETGDFNVGQVWARVAGAYYLLDQIRGQWDQPTVKCALALMAVRYPKAKQHLIEAAGFGPEVKDELSRGSKDYVVSEEMRGKLAMTDDERLEVQKIIRRGMSGIMTVAVKGSKPVRARAVSPLIEAGNVYLPEGAEWAAGFLDEVAAFPNGAHDDQVDAMSQALSKLSSFGGSVTRSTGRRVAPAPITQRTGIVPRPTQPVIRRPRGSQGSITRPGRLGTIQRKP